MKIFCINIDNGNEWEQAQAEFARVGLSVERFPAIVEDNRVLAFNKSVMGCMKLAQGQGLLLFEDDVRFDVEVIPIPVMPEGFLTIHFGCNILGFDNTSWEMPTYHSPHLAKLHNCYQSHATFYSAECVKYIIENFPFVTDDYKIEGCVIFDEWLRTNVLTQGRSYLMKPMIAYQRPRKSEIWNTFADYTYCHREGNRWLKENL